MALNWIEEFQPVSDVVILTDSLNSLHEIENVSSDNIVQEIMFKIANLYYMGITVSFVWIPSHCDIYGNEMVDSLAKAALKREYVDIFVKKSYSEIRAMIGRYYNAIWQSQWDASDRGRHLYIVKKNVLPVTSLSCRTRREEVVACRLRFGVARLNHFMYIIGKHPTGMCATCMVRETVEHYLLHCDMFEDERKLMKTEVNQKELNIYVLLQPRNIHIVLKYVKRTNRFRLL